MKESKLARYLTRAKRAREINKQVVRHPLDRWTPWVLLAIWAVDPSLVGFILWYIVGGMVVQFVYLFYVKYTWNKYIFNNNAVQVDVVSDETLRSKGIIGALAIAEENKAILSERYIGGPYETFIVAHECGHVRGKHVGLAAGTEAVMREIIADQMGVKHTSKKVALEALRHLWKEGKGQFQFIPAVYFWSRYLVLRVG